MPRAIPAGSGRRWGGLCSAFAVFRGWWRPKAWPATLGLSWGTKGHSAGWLCKVSLTELAWFMLFFCILFSFAL